MFEMNSSIERCCSRFGKTESFVPGCEHAAVPGTLPNHIVTSLTTGVFSAWPFFANIWSNRGSALSLEPVEVTSELKRLTKRS